MEKISIFANDCVDPVTFDQDFLNECNMLSTYTNFQKIEVDYTHKTLSLVKSFYEDVVQSKNYKISLPVSSNQITQHLDEYSLKFINQLNYKAIFMIQKSKSARARSVYEKIIVDLDKQQQVNQWLQEVAELIQLACKIGFTKLIQMLATSASVPLFLVSRNDDLYKELPLDQVAYNSVELQNLIQQQIKQDFDDEWKKVYSQSAIVMWNQVPVEFPQDLLNLEQNGNNVPVEPINFIQF